MKRVSPEPVRSCIDFGADPDECTETITFYGMGSNDNCDWEGNGPNYGESGLEEIAEEEFEGICHGQGRASGAGYEPHSDPFADEEEWSDQSRFLAGDGEAMMYPTRDTIFICIGSGDGWGNENGDGLVRGEWAAL